MDKRYQKMMEKGLEGFLKERRLFSKFKRRFDEEFYNKHYEGTGRPVTIGTAFNWSRTPEDREYWFDLQRTFRGLKTEPQDPERPLI